MAETKNTFRNLQILEHGRTAARDLLKDQYFEMVEPFKSNGKIVKTFDFTASYWEKDNPYGSESKNARRNPFDIRKEGNRVRFFWRGSYYYYTDSAIENVKASKVQFFAGQFKGRNTSTQKVTHMYINNLTNNANLDQ